MSANIWYTLYRRQQFNNGIQLHYGYKGTRTRTLYVLDTRDTDYIGLPYTGAEMTLTFLLRVSALNLDFFVFVLFTRMVTVSRHRCDRVLQASHLRTAVCHQIYPSRANLTVSVPRVLYTARWEVFSNIRSLALALIEVRRHSIATTGENADII